MRREGGAVRGKFLSLEGIEGTGKSTQLPAIAEELSRRGIAHVTTREPGGTAFGDRAREMLLAAELAPTRPEAELLLFFAARAELLHTVIAPALGAGRWVLADRFVDASFAYQGAGRGLGQERVQRLADWLLPQELLPDLVIVLDADIPTAMARVRARTRQAAPADRFERERAEFFERARQCYLQRAAADPGRYRIVDASRPAEKVAGDLRAQVRGLL